MSREPALTYEGALRILGRNDRKWLARLNTLLGGAILAAGVATFGAPAAAAPVLKEMFGWIEQKNEAMKLLHKALDALPERLCGTAGLERRELIIAAHSTIVVAAYLEALREVAGARTYDELEITDQETRRLAGITKNLYSSDIPAPSASRGYAENKDHVSNWMSEVQRGLTDFVDGLAAGPLVVKQAEVGRRAVQRYESYFIRLAAAAPEFRAWIELNEHSATRSKLAEQDEILRLFQGQSEALARVERLLLTTRPTAVQASAAQGANDQCASVANANRAALDEMIIPESTAEQYGRHLAFPTVRQIFVNPRYRFATADREGRLADDTWWTDCQVNDDLDVRLVAHICSAEAASLPLLVLGHPGAGKSMLTRVIAARLPEASYTVVRVPLRHVSAHAPVYDQIQQALDRATNHRAVWSELVEQSLATVRVVILDGLDELLHQAQTSLYSYLRLVQDFQRTELAQGRPVVVIVTSRTVVSDRVDIPDGTPVIKLEEFDDGQIGAWLDAWKETNRAGIATGATRALPLKVALEQRDLTAQPLLLMMMAIYVADPQVPVIDEKISPAELYERLLTHFAEREAAKSPAGRSPEKIRKDVETQLRHLSIAALGMFNRGRQDISAEELGTDLAALERLTGNATDAGHKVLGKFFFVYVAEARLAELDAPNRHYEFLHATFGEYLVARLVVEELIEVAAAAFSSRRGIREPDDDLLFALLSFEVVPARLPILSFAEEICARLDETTREQVAEVVTTLIGGYRDRHGSDKYQDYRPKPVDRVRELAAYTANLVLLRVAIDTRGRVPISEVVRDVPLPGRPWDSMLAVWQAGLDVEPYNGILATLANDQGRLTIVRTYSILEFNDQLTALLAGDRFTASAIRYGYGFTSNFFDARPGDDWAEVNQSWLAVALANWSPVLHSNLLPPPQDTDPDQLDNFLRRLAMLLKTRGVDLNIHQAKDFIRLLMERGYQDPVALTTAVIAQPRLISEIPELGNPDLYSDPVAELMFRAEFEGYLIPQELEALYEEIRQRGSLGKVSVRTLAAVRLLMSSLRWPPSDMAREGSHVLLDRLSWGLDEDEAPQP